MILPDNPLSWPLFPILPLRRKGTTPMTAVPEDLGLLGAKREGGAPVPVPTVVVINLCDAGGRNLADLWADPTVVKVEYPNLDALLAEWEVD